MSATAFLGAGVQRLPADGRIGPGLGPVRPRCRQLRAPTDVSQVWTTPMSTPWDPPEVAAVVGVAVIGDGHDGAVEDDGTAGVADVGAAAAHVIGIAVELQDLRSELLAG